MDTEMRNNLNEIRKIEDKHGLVLFRFALTHLVDVGHRNFDDDIVAENVNAIMAQGAEGGASEITFMPPEYQCAILHCAAELAKFSIWTLFAYIKMHVHVDI